MSFAVDVKKELSSLDFKIESLRAELYGIIRSRGEVLIREKKPVLQIDLTSSFLARRVFSLIKCIYNDEINLYKTDKKTFNKLNKFRIEIENATKILLDLEITDENFIYNFFVPKKFSNYNQDVLRGIFLMRGSLNNPENKNYHLEIVSQDKVLTSFLEKALTKFNLEPKTTFKRGSDIIYLKKSEKIGDFLKMIGAIDTLFAFEELRIKRDMNNVINRIVNCDIANGERSHKACERQLKAISELEKRGYQFSESEKQIVYLRKTYPYESLKELENKSKELIKKVIHKSKLSECFKKFIKLSEEEDANWL